jgi:hypothetical protein
MQRDLERRLRKAQARRFVSARVAAILRAFDGFFAGGAAIDDTRRTRSMR